MTTLESVESELAAADEAREVQREVVRHLVEQIAELGRDRDRALACERAALGLVAEWRERVARAERIEEVARKYGNPAPDCDCIWNGTGATAKPCPHRQLAAALETP